MFMLSDIASQPSPSASLNTALSSSVVKPASVFASITPLSAGAITFSRGNSLALAKSAVQTAPVIESVKLTPVSTAVVNSGTKQPASGSGSEFMTIAKDVLSAGLNLGANILMSKYTKNDQPTSPASPSGTPKTDATPAVVVYDPARPASENVNAGAQYLQNLLGAFMETKQTANGQVVQQPSMMGYLAIGAVILAVILLMRKG